MSGSVKKLAHPANDSFGAILVLIILTAMIVAYLLIRSSSGFTSLIPGSGRSSYTGLSQSDRDGIELQTATFRPSLGEDDDEQHNNNEEKTESSEEKV